jgi:hypothetical protein
LWPNTIGAGIVDELAYLYVDRQLYIYPYDVMAGSTIYRETGWVMHFGTKIHYFELNDPSP